MAWRHRFVKQGVNGLLNAPRCGAWRSVLDQHVERLDTTTLKTWTTHSLATKLYVSRAALWRNWRPFALALHRVWTPEPSTDPLLTMELQDIVGLNIIAPDRALVLCVDKKSTIQATSDTAPALPMRPDHLQAPYP